MWINTINKKTKDTAEVLCYPNPWDRNSVKIVNIPPFQRFPATRFKYEEICFRTKNMNRIIMTNSQTTFLGPHCITAKYQGPTEADTKVDRSCATPVVGFFIKAISGPTLLVAPSSNRTGCHNKLVGSKLGSLEAESNSRYYFVISYS